jgi:DNA phosphorothioation-dependent restriction protein DptG
MSGLHQFVRVSRAQFQCNKKMVRTIYVSELIHSSNGHSLDKYISDRGAVINLSGGVTPATRLQNGA